NKGRETKQFYMYAVCLTESGKHIGNLKVGPIDYKNMNSDLVTVIWDRNEWGKGLATEAIKLGNKIAFEEYNIRKLTGGMYSSNVGSIKAYTKAGWIIEGTLQNQYVLNGKLEDRVMVSCFNPCYFQK
ncbi:MAG: GNAT family N-acetyltransferase, partial [Bacteroidota bacterium]